MTSKTGIFIVIEGTDGSGKGTQFTLLAKQLQEAGHDVALFDFPQYEHPSSYFVKKYLNGDYGTAEEVGPYTGSLFYALDRYDAASAIREALAAGKIVLANRFTASNMGHQGTKFDNAEQRRGFFIWLDNLEFETLQIPRPDMNIVLRVPADTAQQLVDQKDERSYTDKKRDLHEADLSHLERAVEVYDDLCQLFPKDFSRIDCVRGGELLSIAAVNKLISEKIIPLLPPQPASDAIPVTPAAPSEVPHSILQDELAQATNKDEQLLNTLFVVKDASNLLTKKLEHGRLATYVEKPTLDYDKKDAGGSYKYYIPQEFDPATTQAYKQAMDDIFNRYSVLVQKLTDHLREHSSTSENKRDATWKNDTRTQAREVARPVLPISAKTTIEIYANAQALEATVTRLLADDLPEANAAGHNMLREAQKTTPALLENADTLEQGNILTKYLTETRRNTAKITQAYLPDHHSKGGTDPVTLSDIWPHNELDIVADILYEHSDSSLHTLRDEVETWSYDKKAQVLQAYIGNRLDSRHLPGRALEKIHYSWDIVCSYDIFSSLQRHHIVDSLEWQEFTPRLGYETPALIEEAGMSDLFDECFDISLKLHGLLMQNNFASQAQYATLQGHKLRWKVTYNAREAFRILELHASTQGRPGNRALVLAMHEKLASVHPLIAESMKL